MTFRFFHRVRDVVPSEDGKGIDALKIGVQARIQGDGEYQPLIDVKGLTSWPSRPHYQQLVDGEKKSGASACAARRPSLPSVVQSAAR